MGSIEPGVESLGKGAKRGSSLTTQKRASQLVTANWILTCCCCCLVLLFVAAIWIAHSQGYNQAYKVAQVQQAKAENLQSQLNDLQTKISSGDYLTIKEWGIKLPLATPISAATYSMMNNSWDGHQTAFLSTAMMDNSPVCRQFFAADPAHPTFEWITKYSPSDPIKPPQANGATVTASSAVQQWPNNYRLVNGSVYAFSQSSGSSCPQESIAMQEAYQQAFKSF